LVAMQPQRWSASPIDGGGPDCSRLGSSAGTGPRGRRSRPINPCWHNRVAMSKVAVIGAGYVGLTTAACLADLGNNVVVVDIDERKIAELQRNRVPFYEPGINELVERNARARLKTNPKHPAPVVSNPEFLREGSAIQDFMHPDRIVVGSHDREAAEKVARLYAPLDAPVLITPNIYTAEMVKYASNAFLATRISFINEIAMISERVGADAKLVAEGMGLDKRIGPNYLDAGIGYGGSCFPKDVAALSAVAEGFNYHPELLHAVMDINREQRMLVIDLLREALDELPGRVIGLLGLSFKPNTDDMREAPSIDIAKVLLAAGAEVRAYDPAAVERSRVLLPEVEYLKDAYAVAAGADALVLVTEWNEFRQLDMARIKQLMRNPV